MWTSTRGEGSPSCVDRGRGVKNLIFFNMSQMDGPEHRSSFDENNYSVSKSWIVFRHRICCETYFCGGKFRRRRLSHHKYIVHINCCGCLLACLIDCRQGHCVHVYISELIR